MSTYIQNKNNPLRIDQLDAPAWLAKYLNYLVAIENLTPNTVNSYYIQIRKFLRWYMMRDAAQTPDAGEMAELPIKDFPLSSIQQLTATEIYEYISFAGSVEGSAATTRALKLAVLKKLFYYLTVVDGSVQIDPTKGIKTPKQEKILPKYLQSDECDALLAAVSESNAPERDYCIVTLFLNCGMRLSELVGINMSDLKKDNVLIIRGKGRKERAIYLNSACKAALSDYIAVRQITPGAANNPALLLSRGGNRITGRRVEQIIEKALLAAGLEDRGYSPHKLRHTAATLMFQEGGADVLTIQKVLGHTSVQTTQIYTHTSDSMVQDVMLHSPLAEKRRKAE